MRVTRDEAELLSDPALSLPTYGYVIDQDSGDKVKFDPFRVTYNLQQTIVGYVSEPPRDPFDYTKWLVVLTGRQSGKSTTAELSFYPKIAYIPGWNHVCIADTKERADELHTRQMFCHRNWDPAVRTEQLSINETRTLSLENGSKSVVLSAQTLAAGIGRSISSLLASEVAFWPDAGTAWSLMQPALINRKFSLVVQECTPAPLAMASAQWWRDQCKDAQKGEGRFLYAFFPFWDSKLNRRAWPKGQKPDSEEEKLLNTYGKYGLTLDNLMFRRVVMGTDKEIKRNPELFRVYYPFDDSSCWISTASAVIPARLLESRLHELLPEGDGYTEFEPPKATSTYVIGADPAGYGGRDHAAFQVLEVWSGEWRQVASFGAVCDPEEFAQRLFDAGIRYNHANIAVERNGVGLATITLLKSKGYPRLFYDSWQKPGFHKHSDDDMTAMLVDALLGPLLIYGKDTYDQLISYQADKTVEKTQRSAILAAGKEDRTRRSRHHWDKVSALMMAVIAARGQPNRFKPVEHVPEPPKGFDQMSYNELVKYDRETKVASAKMRISKKRAFRRKR